MTTDIDMEYYETKLIPLIQNSKIPPHELEQKLTSIMQKFYDELDEQGEPPEEIFDQWNTMLANLIITHGIRSH